MTNITLPVITQTMRAQREEEHATKLYNMVDNDIVGLWIAGNLTTADDYSAFRDMALYCAKHSDTPIADFMDALKAKFKATYLNQMPSTHPVVVEVMNTVADNYDWWTAAVNIMEEI